MYVEFDVIITADRKKIMNRLIVHKDHPFVHIEIINKL